jgi:hypothetical protein
VEPPPPGSIQEFGDINVRVNETTVDTVIVGPDTFYNAKAYRVSFTVKGWNPSAGEPVIFNVYKYFKNTETWNLLFRMFGGGKGFALQDTVEYIDSSGNIDTLVYTGVLDTTIVVGDEDKSDFYFGIAALTQLEPVVPMKKYEWGIEHERFKSRLLGGGVTRFFYINNDDAYTASNVVTVKARFNTVGIPELYYLKHSSRIQMRFEDIFSIDSVLKHAGPNDSHYVDLKEFRIRLSDSLIFSKGVNIGRFGGLDTIRISDLSTHFSVIPTPGGDSGWVDVVKTDTLPNGFGQKSIFMHHPNWASPLSDKIDIRTYNAQITLDLANVNHHVSNVENRYCVLEDIIPFIFDAFGDTTFENEIWVWMATRNLSDRFLNSAGIFTDPIIQKNAFNMQMSWADAILETPPQRFYLKSPGYATGELNPDYEKGYRVSPLAYLYLQALDIDAQGTFEYDESYLSKRGLPILKRPDSKYLGLLMKKGSILGYDESALNDFKTQDSILTDNTGKIERIPAAGWFEYVPLHIVSPGGTYSIDNLIQYFGSKFNVSTHRDLYPGKDETGKKYFSIYSAFFYQPDPANRRGRPFRHLLIPDLVKIYKNPMRNVPYFIPQAINGSKEFVICVLARGKYFKEPRAFISSLTTTHKFVWDRISPNFMWADTIDPTADRYAPMYFSGMVNFKPFERNTNLEATDVAYVFDVALSSRSPHISKLCAVRDVGFGRIVAVDLCFNFSSDLISVDPVTGLRTYQNKTIVSALDENALSRQEQTTYRSEEGKIIGLSYSLGNTIFKNIDARLWQNGIWDMWLETEDDLGNRGIAALTSGLYDRPLGKDMVRQIKIERKIE